MVFLNRQHAGKELAKKLKQSSLKNLIVLALPRGGVPVGFEIAQYLKAPLEVLVVRKISLPENPELGIGAIAEGDFLFLNHNIITSLRLSKEDIAKVINQEKVELNRRIKLYRNNRPLPNLKNKQVILVDDGLATGVSAQVAIKAILKQNPEKLIIALPVCSSDSVASFKKSIRPFRDDIICLLKVVDLKAVGFWYKNFEQVSDYQVVKLLSHHKR